MKILFNCTTNVVGGGLRISSLFIKKAINDTTFNWHFAVSQQVYDLLLLWGLQLNDDKFTLVLKSPARNKQSREKLSRLVRDLNIDIVYTMAGPAYVKFKCLHIQGIANGYITHPEKSVFLLQKSFIKTLKYYMYTYVQYLYSVKADYFIFETDYARKSFQKRSGISENKMFVVPNAFDKELRSHFTDSAEISLSKNEAITIFCPGAAYIHKGFQFIPQIAYHLKKLTSRPFQFILTLPEDSAVWKKIKESSEKLDVSGHIYNHGPYQYTQLIGLLQQAHMVFVPSLFETFSASYLEAMCAGKRLLVADRPFAREVCGDYAVYTNPTQPKDASEALFNQFDSLQLTADEKKRADDILSKYGGQDERFLTIINTIKKITS